MTDHEARAREIACPFANEGSIYNCGSYSGSNLAEKEHTSNCDDMTSTISQALREAEEAEREACALLADTAERTKRETANEVKAENWKLASQLLALADGAMDLAASIRSRGEKDNG